MKFKVNRTAKHSWFKGVIIRYLLHLFISHSPGMHSECIAFRAFVYWSGKRKKLIDWERQVQFAATDAEEFPLTTEKTDVGSLSSEEGEFLVMKFSGNKCFEDGVRVRRVSTNVRVK